jgi:hypothetical protein
VEDQPSIEDVLRAYIEVWSEPDPERQRELLRACWTEESEIFGPQYYFKGTDAVVDEVARIHRDHPGFHPVVTSGLDQHGHWVRFGIAVLNPSGAKVQEGWDVVELDAQQKIRRVVTFWGVLPPVPSHWPARVQPLVAP